MKDRKQIIIIVLLIANLTATIFLYTGMKKIGNDIQDVQDNIYYNLKIITSDINSQLEETLLKDDFRVVDMEAVFSDEANEKKMLEGRISFELTDNIDLESVHVIVSQEGTDEYEKVDVVELGGLQYRADIELDYSKNYTYYVIGETQDGEDVMLSDKHDFQLKDKIKERVYTQTNTISIASGEFSANGLIQVDGRYEIEKIEAVLIYYEENVDMGTAKIAGEIARADITDSLVPADEIKMNGGYMETMPGYEMHGFEFTKDAEGYDGQELYGLKFIVTFSDGAMVEVVDW